MGASARAAGGALPRSRLLGFAVGNVGAATFATVPGLLLAIYLTDTLGVPALAAGLVVVVPKVWDVVLAPVVGAWSDREVARTGHRTRLMLMGALGLPVLFALMFASPFVGTGGLLWVLALYLAAATAYVLFQVPYITLPTEMSESPTERTRVMGWRIMAVTLGILLGGVVAPLLVTIGGEGRAGHVVMGVGVALLIALTTLVCVARTRWVRGRAGAHAVGLRQTWATARGNRAFLLLAGAYVPQAVSVAMLQASIAYVAAYRLDDRGLTAVLFAALVVPSLVAVPIWTKVAGRIGKVRAFTLATLLFAVACLGLLPAVLIGSAALTIALAAVIGVAFAGEQVMPFAMLPDVILEDADDPTSGGPGVLTGAFSAGETAAFAIGPGIFLGLLQLAGYRSTTGDEVVAQNDGALLTIALGFSVVPAVLLLLTLPLIRRYGATDAARAGDAHVEPVAPGTLAP